MWGSTKIGLGRWPSRAGDVGSSPAPHANSFTGHCTAFILIVWLTLCVVSCLPQHPVLAKPDNVVEFGQHEVPFGYDVDIYHPIYYPGPPAFEDIRC